MMRAFFVERSLTSMSCRFLVTPAIALACGVTASLGPAAAADPPASPQQAAAVIDLTTFAPIRPVETDRKIQATIASQSYIANGAVAALANELKGRLVQAGWRELDGAMITDGYASVTLQKAGFTLSLTVMPSGKPGEAHVVLTNHGNVDFKQLPLPAELKPQFQTPVMSMLQSPSGVEETTARITRALTSAGWQPYGAPAGSVHFKQNGVRLMVSITAAPAQNNATVVQVASEQMSADLPVPEGAEAVQYSDAIRQVAFDHPAAQPAVFGSLVSLLAERGWQVTTSSPIKIDFREHLIFRNKAGEMIEADCHSVDQKTRCRMEYRSAAEVEAANRAADAEVARRAAMAAQQATKTPLRITTPAGAKVAESSESAVEFSLPSGRALAAVSAWLTSYEQAGWKLTTNVREAAAGDFELQKDSLRLHVTHLDPGFIPATISVTVFGAGVLRVDE